MTMQLHTKRPGWNVGAHRSGAHGAEGFAAFVADWWKWAAAGGIGLVVLSAAIAGYFMWNGRKESDSTALLRKAISRLEAGQQTGQNGAAVEEGLRLVQEVLNRFPATTAAGEATLRLGAHYYTAGKYDEARTTYVAYLGRNPRGRIAFSAGMGVGDTFLAQRNFEKAIETYSQLGERFPQEALLPEAQLHLVSALLGANRLKDALAVCEKIIAAYPNTGWAQRAQAELNRHSLSSSQVILQQ